MPSNEPSTEPSSEPRNEPRWSYTPELPLAPAPFLRRPFDGPAIGRHVARSWRPHSPRVLMLATAVVVWRWFSPSLAEAESFELSWILPIWIRNTTLIALAAGLPHLWLYVWRRQGERSRYDARPLGKNKRRFLFNDQVKDNMFLSLVPAPLIGTAWEAAGWWAYANGIAPGSAIGDNPIWFVTMILIVPLWSVLYFSVGHWLLHRGPAYTHVHSWHHRNVNVGPWSGLAMHPGEHVVLYGDVLLFLVLPSHPIHFLFAMMHHHLGAPLSHTGYDGIEAGPITLPVGDFHHQLHHRFIECNYGGFESPLDDLVDAWHDGTEAGDAKIARRRKQLAAARRGDS